MISDTIESNATPETETPKARRKAAKKPKPAKKPAACEEGRQAEDGTRQQEGRSNRADEARQRRDTSGDYESHGLAAAHRAGLRQHPGQQGRQEGESGERGGEEQDVVRGIVSELHGL